MNKHRSAGTLKSVNYFRCILSAGLLILAHPKAELSFLIWIGLVPLMFTLDGKKPLEAFGWAYMCGMLFFTGALFWLFQLTQWFSFIALLGVLLLFAYLALYYGLFGFCYSFFSRRGKLYKLFLFPSVWVALEFTRGHLFTGFEWVTLGYSQYKNLPIIQIADITGVLGVSFMIVMTNMVVKEFIAAHIIIKTKKAQRDLAVSLLTIGLIFMFVMGYGVMRLSSSENQDQKEVPSLSVAVIQANIPQEIKWDEPSWPKILDKHMALSREVVAQRPDLIVWPETSYPGYLWEDNDLFEEIQAFVQRVQTPLLLGSVVKEGRDYYNSALLLSQDGEVVEIYRKVHLVPFGEYLPLRGIFPFLSELVQIGDFTSGQKWTTFTLKDVKPGYGESRAFSVLICFEDTVARLSRQFVKRGAQFLVNITNDAWFGDSRAPYMHLQSSVFRTVENRRALVRAANTGVSCMINRWGSILNCVTSDVDSVPKATYVSGMMVGKADFHEKMTFYTKFGDVFTFICFGCILWGIIRKEPDRD